MTEHTETFEERRLEKWLSVATKGLTEDACARIGEEISAHYEDVVSTAVDEGGSGWDAHEKAYASLGSARVARRAFRRVYFTKFELKNLKKLSPTLYWLHLLLLASWGGLAWFALFVEKDLHEAVLPLFCFLATLLDMGQRVSLRRRWYKRIVVAGCLSSFALVVFPVVYFCSETRHAIYWDRLVMFEAFALPMAFYVSYFSVRLSQKLRRIAKDGTL